jgi:DNA polymerase-3 subunit delta'
MDSARTRGHPAALAAVRAMIQGRAPHAVLLVGPSGVGKSTLARDLAAGLLCGAADPGGRPCGACRACRLVAAGHHPDVHVLGPEGPGRQVVIGGPGSKVRGVRDLIGELALLPVEGGARIAIVEGASRLNEDAQAALLKTLEEPPSGVTLILCADAEEPLLPTIRSRCARLRLGPVGVREIEAILGDADLADAPLAARLARIADGRPGVAVAWARDPDGLLVRDELARVLVDLAAKAPADRLADVRAAAGRAARLTGVLDRAGDDPADTLATAGRSATGRGRRPAAGARAAADAEAPADAAASAAEPAADAAETDDEPVATTRTPASERRRAIEVLIALWMDLARDLLLLSRDLPGSVRELALLDELQATARRLDPADLATAVDRLARAQVLLGNNVSPELLLDDLALTWPAPRRAAA